MRLSMSPFVLAAVMLVTSAPTLCAQSERVQVSSAISGIVGDGGPARTVSVAGGFHLAPHSGLEVELLYVPEQTINRDAFIVPLTFPSPSPRSAESSVRTLAFLSSFVADFETGRLRPYAQFGGGIANVRHRTTVAGSLGGSVSTTPGSTSPAATSATTSALTENALALTAGAGLDVRVWKRLGLAVELRYLRLFASSQSLSEIEHLTRVGGRIVYRF